MLRVGSFGIGTSLTNDFRKKSSGGTEKSKALNMVIKLSSVEGKPAVKISDEITKVCIDACPTEMRLDADSQARTRETLRQYNM